MKLSCVIVVLAFLFLIPKSHAGELSVETDPSTFAFSGYAAHVRYRLTDNWEIGVGTYAMTFPNALNSLALNSAPSTTTLKISSAYGLFIDRYLTGKGVGWFAGLQLAEHYYQLTDTNFAGQTTTYSAFLAMPRIGYKFQFEGTGLYLLPWAGVAYVTPSNSNPTVGTQSYKVNSALPFATLHIGYSF